jgi:hypothetical protein
LSYWSGNSLHLVKQSDALSMQEKTHSLGDNSGGSASLEMQSLRPNNHQAIFRIPLLSPEKVPSGREDGRITVRGISLPSQYHQKPAQSDI